MTTTEVQPKAQVIHVDFKSEKRRKTPASPARKAQSVESTEAYFIPASASIHPIRAWSGVSLRDRMMDISGWWIRLTVFVTLVALGYLAFG